jgi:hypothetical protein
LPNIPHCNQINGVFVLTTTLSDEILKRANRAKKERENQNIATTILLDA